MKAVIVATVYCFLVLSGAVPALAGDPPAVRLSITTTGFAPQELKLPVGVQVKLLIRNEASLPAEFESYDLSRELVVPGHTQVTAYVGPLKPGHYRFFNDFNHAMQGAVVVGESAK